MCAGVNLTYNIQSNVFHEKLFVVRANSFERTQLIMKYYKIIKIVAADDECILMKN